MTKKFMFLFPVTQGRTDLHRPDGIRFDHVADFEVKGTVSFNPASLPGQDDLYEYKIDTILYDGMDIYPLVNVFTTLADIQAACKNHLQSLFAPKSTPVFTIGKASGKLVSLHRAGKVKES